MIFAQIEHADDAWKIGTEYGILGVLVMGGALCLVATGIYFARQLIGKNGIVREWQADASECNKSLASTMAKLEVTSATQRDQCERHVNAMDSLDKATTELVQLHSDPHSPFATAHLTNAANAACDVLDKALPDCAEQIERVRRKLRGD